MIELDVRITADGEVKLNISIPADTWRQSDVVKTFNTPFP